MTDEGPASPWARLAAPLPPGAISWRQDGKATARDGKFFARFVPYIDAHTVRERLDAVVPGWSYDLQVIPPRDVMQNNAALDYDQQIAVVGTITLDNGIEATGRRAFLSRSDIGSGATYKEAATDAFKRTAVRFGIGAELYEMQQNWVEVDGDGKFAKPVEDPQIAYNRRHGGTSPVRASGRGERDIPAGRSAGQEGGRPSESPPTQSTTTLTDADSVSCPKCGGRTWDNRATKRSPKAPDFKCRDRTCDGVVWPPRNTGASVPQPGQEQDIPPFEEDDEMPF